MKLIKYIFILLILYIFFALGEMIASFYESNYPNASMNTQHLFKYVCKNNRTKFIPDVKIINDIKSRFKNDLPKINSFINEEFSYYKQNTDSDSQKILDLVMGSILVSLNCDPFHYSGSKIQGRIHDEFKKELPSIKNKYKVYMYVPEVFWSHHGLRNENQKILDYIKERDILDIGAFCGDSLIVLLPYTDKIVYSYEYSPSNVKLIQKAIKENKLDENRIRLYNKGIGNETKTIKTSFKRALQSQINNNEHGYEVNITTIDNECKKLNIKVGFMKADIEGMELQALQGAVETIKMQRPIISFSIYHNFNGLFKVRHFLDQFPNYAFKYKIGSHYHYSFGELIIFAYPKELSI